MYTMHILYTMYTLYTDVCPVYPVFLCILCIPCIPMYTLYTDVYPVYPCTPCIPNHPDTLRQLSLQFSCLVPSRSRSRFACKGSRGKNKTRARRRQGARSGALSIQQKFRFEFWKIHVPNETVHSGCTDPTQATTYLVIIWLSFL